VGKKVISAWKKYFFSRWPAWKKVDLAKKDYFFDKKKYNFFHARISRSGKGRESDFLGVEGVGSRRVAEKVTHEAPTASGIREVEKSTFFWWRWDFLW
jgi:hypothetical protein